MIEQQNRKPLGRKAYGSIPHLPNSRMGPGDHKCSPGMERIATVKTRDKHDVVIVQEKLDGSNVAIAKHDGQILALTRAGYLATSSPYEQHHVFDTWVFQRRALFADMLDEGERLCGEWLALAHGTRYGLEHQSPHSPFVPFDIMRGTDRALFIEVFDRTMEWGFLAPTVINEYMQPMDVETAMQRLEPRPYQHGYRGALEPVEGAVWRVERKGKVDFLVKYVRSDKIDGKYLPEISGKPAVWNWQP